MKEAVITRRREAWNSHFRSLSMQRKAKEFVRDVAKLEYVSSVTLHNVWHQEMVVNTFEKTGPTMRELNEIVAMRDSVSSFEELPVHVLSESDRFRMLHLRLPREVLMYKKRESKKRKASAVA